MLKISRDAEKYVDITANYQLDTDKGQVQLPKLDCKLLTACMMHKSLLYS